MVWKLEGKWALLTGAASGMGRETSLLLAGEGCNLVLVDKDTEGLKKVEEEVREKGVESFSVSADITSSSDIQSLVKEARRRTGGIDILVNTAGIGQSADLRHTTEEEWRRLFEINFFSQIKMTNSFLPMLIESKGQIVNFSSGQAFFPVPTWGAYAASKAAFATYSECLSWELSVFGIRVTTVFPGLVKTHFYDKIKPANFPQKFVLWYIHALGSNPQRVAKKIVRGIKHRKRRVVQSWYNWLTYLGRRPGGVLYDLVGEGFSLALCDRQPEIEGNLSENTGAVC
ncbi:MAG: SDR family NAD(P)-dependent oxidoreductase [Actinomycetota bacterium]|nr:SDR family NAD(P)-dependent oxidoreductase [Actinomycetota bacterium]